MWFLQYRRSPGNGAGCLPIRKVREEDKTFHRRGRGDRRVKNLFEFFREVTDDPLDPIHQAFDVEVDASEIAFNSLPDLISACSAFSAVNDQVYRTVRYCSSKKIGRWRSICMRPSGVQSMESGRTVSQPSCSS